MDFFFAETPRNNEVAWNRMAVAGFWVAILSFACVLGAYYASCYSIVCIRSGFLALAGLLLGIIGFGFGVKGIQQIKRTKEKGFILALLALSPVCTFFLYLVWNTLVNL